MLTDKLCYMCSVFSQIEAFNLKSKVDVKITQVLAVTSECREKSDLSDFECDIIVGARCSVCARCVGMRFF